MSETIDFMKSLWDGMPTGSAIQVWTRSDKTTYYSSGPAAASQAAAKHKDVDDCYVAAGLAAKVMRPNRQRAHADQVVGIPGLWADIDVNGGPESKMGAAPDRDSAIELAHSLLEPTLLVNSGYGVQAWWLFEGGPWLFGSPEERVQAQRLSAAYQAALKSKAALQGFSIDATHDLARLMRIPGTFNHKGVEKGYDPAPVSIFELEGNRYELSTLGELTEAYMGEVVEGLRRASGEGISVESHPGASPPVDKLELLIDVDPDFARVWRHQSTSRTRNWSMSEYEMSITSRLVRAGWSDQEIANALVYHRNKFEPGDPKRKNRPARLALTIGKARVSIEREEMNEEAEFEREEAIEQLSAIGRSPAPGAVDRERALSLFNRVIGGPQIKELLQYGLDPETARFVVVLADGREIAIGAIDKLTTLKMFRNSFAVVTQHYPRAVKVTKWEEVVQGLLAGVKVLAGDEDTRVSRVKGWLEAYLNRKVSTDRDAACHRQDPFEDDDTVYVPLADFRKFLRKIEGERIETADLRLMLVAAGFERRTVSYKKPEGSPSSRSYFAASKELVGPA